MDRAQDRAAEYTADALRAHWRRQPLGQGLSHCEDCGAEIPEPRRRAKPDCTRCLSCQAEFETHSRRNL